MTTAGNYKPAAVKEDGTLDMVAVQRDWMTIIERHERKRGPWISRCEKIAKIYADAENKITKSAERKYCVLWANVQTRAPAAYARAPKCVVSRRYQTPDENVRTAVLALERATNIEIVNSKLHEAILSARLDRLLAGRGTVWIRYEAQDDGETITSQRLYTEFVPYKDFGHGEGRVWEETDCVWRRTYYSDERLKKRFGDDVMDRCSVTLDYAEKDAPDGERQATIYEVWCKSRNAVYWLAKTARAALEVGPPPLDLKNFWPCPKPVFGTLNNESCIPTPDYIYYQDQAEEITRLTRRIDKLTDSLKLVGFYPAGPSTEGRAEIERAMSPSVENKLIPVASWAAFAEKGGANQIVWLPVDMVLKIIEGCIKLRQQLLNDVDQITGISDIMRGETVASETLGAQQLKSQYGSQRIRDTVDDFVRFAKEACEIHAVFGAVAGSAETIGKITALTPYATQQVPGPADPQTGKPGPAQQQVVTDPKTTQPMPAPWLQLLRNQIAREVLIDVETDSTIQPDEDAEKQRRMEFMTAFTQSMTPLMELNQLDPMLAAAVMPLWGDTVLFVVRGFRAGRELEETIEQTVQQLQQIVQAKAAQAQQAQQQGGTQPSPADIEAAKQQAALQANDAKNAQNAKAHEAELARNEAADQRKTERVAQVETLKHNLKMREMIRGARIAARGQMMQPMPAPMQAADGDTGDGAAADQMATPDDADFTDTETKLLTMLAEAIARMATAQERTAIATEHAAMVAAAPRALHKTADGRKVAVPMLPAPQAMN